jgi:hypothetical protein
MSTSSNWHHKLCLLSSKLFIFPCFSNQLVALFKDRVVRRCQITKQLCWLWQSNALCDKALIQLYTLVSLRALLFCHRDCQSIVCPADLQLAFRLASKRSMFGNFQNFSVSNLNWFLILSPSKSPRSSYRQVTARTWVSVFQVALVTYRKFCEKKTWSRLDHDKFKDIKCITVV